MKQALQVVQSPQKQQLKAAQSAKRRAAYRAAYRIQTTDTRFSHLACPGGRKSRQLEAIAAIIEEEWDRKNLDVAWVEPCNDYID